MEDDSLVIKHLVTLPTVNRGGEQRPTVKAVLVVDGRSRGEQAAQDWQTIAAQHRHQQCSATTTCIRAWQILLGTS